MHVRRVVTGLDENGRAAIVSDGPAPRAYVFEHTPGYQSAMIWAEEGIPTVPNAGVDVTPQVTAQIPGPGGSRLIMIQVPPANVYDSPDFDAAAADAEHRRNAPGLRDYFEEGSRFHATPSVDYHVMLEGELWLLVGEDRETRLEAGDVVIQNGTRHTWVNRSDRPARFLTIPIGAYWAPPEPA